MYFTASVCHLALASLPAAFQKVKVSVFADIPSVAIYVETVVLYMGPLLRFIISDSVFTVLAK